LKGLSLDFYTCGRKGRYSGNHINRKNEENEIETIEAVNSVTRQVKSQQNKILLNKPK